MVRKFKNLLKEASNELDTENDVKARALLKVSLKDVSSAKRTLATAEEAHEDLLNSPLSDIEEFDY